MKKLFTLLFAVVTVAAFAAPALQKASKQQPQKASANIEMQAKKGALYTGKAGMLKDVPRVDTMYMTPKGTFFSAYFPYNGSFFYSYNLALIPTNIETTWTNISIGIASDTYDWVYYNPGIDEEYLTQVEGQKDLVATFPNYPGWWIAPRLYPNAYEENAEYYAFDGAVFMGGKYEDDVLGDGTTLTNMYQFSPRADYNTIMRTSFGAGYGDEANSFYTDLPDGYKPEGSVDGKIQNFIQYFDYPGKPYTFSRIQFYANCTADAGKVLTAKVCKVENNVIDIENPIATATYEFPAQVMDETTAIDFYFEKEDPELGLTEEDWLLIDGEIGIVIEGVNDCEDITPVLNAMSYDIDQAHDELYSQFCNGYALWYFYDNAGEVVDASILPCHMGYYWGDPMYLPENLLLSINAQMAYIETVAESATEYTIPAEGGEYTLKLKASEPYDMWNVDEIPEWMTVEATDSIDTQHNSYAGYTTLAITVQPNNNGTVVYTLPGTEFKIIVGEGSGPGPQVPGDVDGDGYVTAADVTALYTYMLTGSDTELVNGDQDGDGNITGHDVTVVYNILLGVEE